MDLKKILIVDDHDVVRSTVRSLLKPGSDWVVCGDARDGLEAIEETKRLRPDLVVMDVSMPRMDGLAATRTIRRDLPETKVIIISQNDPQLMQKEAQSAGAEGFIEKSRIALNLIPAIENLFQGKEISEEEEKDELRVKGQVFRVLPTEKRNTQPESTQLERKLRLDAEVLAAIVTSSDDAIISKNLDGIITTWNKSAERMFGYAAEEAIGQSITIIIPPERLNEEVDIIARLRRGERIDHFQTVRRRKDGSTLDVSLTISPIRDDSGKVVGASKVARDISEQSRVEKALRESEERLRAIVETTPECVKLVDRNGTLIHMNSSGLQMIGASELDTVLGKSIYGLIAPEHREKFREFNERICAGERGALEFDITGLNGIRRHMETHAAPLRNPDGAIVHLGVARDVTKRKRAEDMLRRHQETLEAEVRLRTLELEERNTDVLRQTEQLRELSRRLMQMQDEERRRMARELHDSAGQTLTILGMNLAQIVQKTGRKSPELAADVEKTQELVQQLHREIRTASYLLHPPLLDEAGLSSALSWYIQGLTERSDLNIQLEIPQQFERLPRDLELAVFRIVQECLTNVHRHSTSKTAAIRIAREADVVTVEVEDNGKGMSPERLLEIQSKGSGVGIRGMRERLRQFGGSLNIFSDESGTRILVMIPVSEASAKENVSEDPLEAVS